MNFNGLVLVSLYSRYVASAVLIDDFLLGLVIVRSLQELNEYAESVIALRPSRKKDGSGSLTVCPSPLTMQLVY